MTVREDGEAETEKFPVPDAFTTRVTVVEWVNPPPVPVIVSVYVPAGVLELVLTFIALLPEPPAIGLVPNVALAPEGNPVTLNVTLLVKPPEGFTVTV
jgi:hypothetical protein